MIEVFPCDSCVNRLAESHRHLPPDDDCPWKVMWHTDEYSVCMGYEQVEIRGVDFLKVSAVIQPHEISLYPFGDGDERGERCWENT